MNLGAGYFSNDPSINPLMYNWSKIYLPYCVSERTAPIIS
jgi:hypothetical protein